MLINWSLFAPGLLMLLIPADRLLSANVQLRTFESFHSLENSPRHRPWWWVPALWLDPIRGFCGTLLLKHGLMVVSKEWMLVPKIAYSVALGLLAASILGQMLTRRERDVMLAPIGFVGGVVAALLPWPVTVIALVMAIAGLFAFRQFHAFFTVGFAMVAAIGFALHTSVAWLAPAVGALILPIIASFLSGSTLELPTRNATGALSRPATPA